ncbi:MAG: hypothetical protein ABWZ65_23665 [Pseudomonas mandelii]
MNSKRVAGWVGFFAVAAGLSWLPEYFQDNADDENAVATLATPAKRKIAPTPANLKAAPIKDLSPAGDLFATRSWRAAPTLAVVTEQPVTVAAVVQTPVVPPMPFQFVGKLADRADLQVFLQNGEKIYVVRKGDVIDDTWRIEGISDVELSLVYLPLHLAQTLSVGSTQ